MLSVSRRDLIQPFRLALRPLVEPGQRYAVGVSGGPDSMALLDLAHRAAPSLDIDLAVAHLDHGWRVRSSEDAALVERAAAARGQRFIGGRLEGVRPSEGEGRAARLAFFREVASSVLLGHSADDQSETVITHLLRGAGTLRGMRSIEDVDGLRLLRPLLGFRRAELREYCQSHGVPFVDDASNRDPAFLRNRVRHELLPLLEALAPGASGRLARLAEVARADLDVVDAAVDAVWRDVVDEQLAIDRPRFRALPEGVQRGVLRRVAIELLGPAPDLSFERLEAVRRALIGGRGGAVVEWPSGARLELERRRGIFRRYPT